MAAGPSEEASDEEMFFHELKGFKIRIPGGSVISFLDNEKMLKLLRQQCPNWEEKVSSVPIGRVPLLFLQNTQMSTQQQEKFKLLQKGERGESKVYQMLMHDEKHKGMLVFPNLNGNEIFKSTIAQVEIDTVIAHATKGFFVFVVKNIGGKGLTPQKMQSDIHRHCNFIRLLIEYGQTNSDRSMPIYPVLCLLQHDDSKERFQSLSFNGETDVLILSKTDLTMENFSLEWGRYLAGLPNHNIDKDVFETSVARLVALMLRDGSGAIIHNKMNTNYMQAFRKNKLQFKDFDYPWKSIIEKASQIKFGGRERIVLWTAKQIEIIKLVLEHLRNADQTGSLRLIVDGCKGSGKTMLLLFFAKIAQQFLLQEDKVLVCNAHFLFATELTKLLKNSLSTCGVSVFDPAGELKKINKEL